MNNATDTLILYHGPACPDGFGAYWAAFRAFGDKATYKPINYGDPVPDVTGFKNIYILDFSFKRDILLKMAENAYVAVLDHHSTAEKELKDLVLPNEGRIVFDMQKSGAMLTWEGFFLEDAPPIIQYVQDRDLWTWKLPESRKISAALDLQPRTFESWDWFNNRLSHAVGFQELVVKGETILTFTDQKVRSLADKSEACTFDNVKVHAVNSSLFQSEIGEAINLKYPDEPFAIVFYFKEGKMIYSLRTKRSDVHIGDIAKKYGGGGHAQAASFSIDFSGVL